MRRIVMKGNTYGRLAVIGETGREVLCSCSCGRIDVYLRGNVLAGYTQSCGCLRNEAVTAACWKHGQSGNTKTKEYEAWKNMRKRCSDPAWHAYNRYGGRGITVCARWINSFETFFADLGSCPPGCELDRIDNNENYTPENCRWIDHRTNCQNRGY